MCFIKRVYHTQDIKDLIKPLTANQQERDIQSPLNETSVFKIQKYENQLYKNVFPDRYQTLLFGLMSASLNRNTQSLSCINKQIQSCQQKIDTIFNDLEDSENEQHSQCHQPSQKDHFTSVCLLEDMTSMSEQLSENALTNKLFGQKKYKYKLTLENEFPEVIYKERNIKVNISLKSMNGKVIKNSNIVNLCFALVDDNGNWINLNRVGDPMLKGKTEVELYHGQAEFNKIYTKDISRTFPNGQVNIVVYPKPSILIYDGLTSEYEEHIDENSIEPLIIGEVVIKAKKKY